MINAFLLATSLVLCQAAQPVVTPGETDAAAPPAKTTAEQRHAQDLKNDSESGAKYAEEVEKQYKVSKNEQYQARVQAIGNQFADIANANQVKVLWGDARLNPFQYHFKVLEGEDVNAFSLPGGYIYVYEGLLKYVESDDELAGVLSHEIAHASFRHLATLRKEESKMQAITLPLILVAILSGGRAGADVLQLGNLVGIATGSGWSQKAEDSADYGGFQYMLKSKYNPVGMFTFLERLAADERLKPQIDWGIYRTHPPTRERADGLIEWLKKAGVPIRRSLVTTFFRTTFKTNMNGNVEAWLGGQKLHEFAGSDAKERAEKAGLRIDEFMDRVPEMFEITVDAYGNVYGRGRLLFQVDDADAKAAKTDVKETTARVLGSIRRSLSSIAIRIWNIS